MGATMRHGAHHGAHRSISTSWLVFSAASRSASVAFTSHGSGWWQEAHCGRPAEATGRRFLVPQDGQAVTALMVRC